MELDWDLINGQTPLDEDEKEGLLLPSITTRGELDEFEQYNIEKAVEWVIRSKFKQDKILSEQFICEIHRKMFGDVWEWAGKFRTSNKNIGVDKNQIAIQLKMLLDDCIFWINKSVYSEDETAIRFKHRIVNIHLFPNGNGRHARLCADIIISHIFKKPPFTWGGTVRYGPREARQKYIQAIKEADAGNIKPLIAFARS